MIASRFCFALALGLAFAAPAQAGTSIVVDASSGEVLASDNPTLAWHPASTTKMMTLYVALKAIQERRVGLQTAIPASKLAASQPRVKVYIRAGQEVTLENALRIMMVKSANDIAYVIAEGIGGDVPSFVAMMNAEAQRLGMRDTVFTNPNGWHDPAQQIQRPRPGHPRHRADARFPSVFGLLEYAGRPARQAGAAEHQWPCRPLSRHQRHEDRLCLRLRLQCRRHRQPRRANPDRRRPGRAVGRRAHGEGGPVAG